MGESSFDFDAAWRAVDPEDVATLIYTSGTTGPPKGVQLTHRNLMAEIRAVADCLPTEPGGRITSFLPSAHIADRWSAHYQSSMVFGFTLTCIADPRTVVQHLPEVRPTAWGSVPRIWEKMKAALEAQGVTDPAALPEEHRAAIREKLGLDQCAWLVVGAAPTPVEVLEYFDALGLPICELWGMSETSSCATINPPDRIKIGTCGPPLKGVELKLADDGELLVRGEIVMKGYRNDPVKTAEAIDDEGWLHTGDVAEIDDDGYVKIVDRKKELIINAAGKNMSPVNIESRLKTCHPLIGTAVAIGDRRPYNVALIVLDPGCLRRVRRRSTASRTAHPPAWPATTRVQEAIAAGDRGGQHPPLARRADQEVVPARSRVATRWRGADADDEAEAAPDRREVRRARSTASTPADRPRYFLHSPLTARGRGWRLHSPCRAWRQRLEPDRARHHLDRRAALELQAVAAVLGRVEGQHVVVARDRLGVDGSPSFTTVSTSGSGFDASKPFSTRALKPASLPRTVSPIMPRITFFLRRTSAVEPHVRPRAPRQLHVGVTRLHTPADARLRELVRIHHGGRGADRRLRAEEARPCGRRCGSRSPRPRRSSRPCRARAPRRRSRSTHTGSAGGGGPVFTSMASTLE